MSLPAPKKSINVKLFEEKIESKRNELKILKDEFKLKGNESINILTRRASEKKKELEDCYWFEILNKSNLRDEIKTLTNQINGLKEIEKCKKEIEMLVEQQNDYIPGYDWEGYPKKLNEKTFKEYASKFKTLKEHLTPDVPYINIIMIGETGAGKSSFLNTFATAITNSSVVKDMFRVAPGQSREASVTKKVHLQAICRDGEDLQLPCKFYDMPGIDKKMTIDRNEFHMIISGRRVLNAELKTDPGIEVECLKLKRTVPTPADVIHCILYVISAGSNISTKTSTSLKLMKEIKESLISEDGVKQFVIVTSIDTIGVPNDDMENAYKYRCVRKLCEKVSVEFGIDLCHVIPVSNYFEEGVPTFAKNAMSLFSLWRVFKSGIDYIDRKWGKREQNADFKKN